MERVLVCVRCVQDACVCVWVWVCVRCVQDVYVCVGMGVCVVMGVREIRAGCVCVYVHVCPPYAVHLLTAPWLPLRLLPPPVPHAF